MAINTKKVLVGGLAAGVVMNIIDFACQTFVIGPRMLTEVKAINEGLAASMGAATPTTMAGFVGVDLALGIVLVLVYASIRPRFGAGSGTAIKAALMVWAASSLQWMVISLLGFFSWAIFAMGCVLALINAVISGLVGAKLYSEE